MSKQFRDWKHAANTLVWAVGQPRHNGFQVRKIVWGKLLATQERRPDEDIKRAKILIRNERAKKKLVVRRNKPIDAPPVIRG